MNIRNIIIHCHLFKNAGSTFDYSLSKSFKSGFLDYREDSKIIENPEYFYNKFFFENKNVKAFSSHHIRFPITTLENINLIPFIILRHPIERAMSVYNFERVQRAKTPGAIHAKQYDFNDYVKWRMSKSTPPVISNFQTRFLISKFSQSNNLTDEDYAAAEHNLINNLHAGIVDKYNLSMVYFEEILKPLFPNLDLSYIKKNVNNKSMLSQEENIDQVLSRMSFDVGKKFIENNVYDLRLYYTAKTLLFKNSNLISNTEHKLNDLKNRCLQR